MKYIIGNWKMNMTAGEIVEFTRGVKKYKIPKNSPVQFGLAVPYVYLLGMAKLQGHVLIGAQNVSEHNNGAFTGEISAEMLADVGLDFCIVGHSERRTLFGETNEMINEKIKKLQEYQVLPLLCIGETEEEFAAGKTKEVLHEQLTKCLANINKEQEIIVAYEPVWAIGTGKTASIEIIRETTAFIKQELQSILGKLGTAVLYGGSVNPQNAPAILHCEGVDGALIGGASLDADKYMQIASTLF